MFTCAGNVRLMPQHPPANAVPVPALWCTWIDDSHSITQALQATI